MTAGPRILVLDGYVEAARRQLQDGGASTAGDLYVRMLQRCLPQARCDVLFPADGSTALPEGVALSDYDGVAWTGCSLTIYDDVPEVRSQVELQREIYRVGLPAFGSCWAAQVAVVAAGGAVQANPKGREMGIARKISLTPEGRAHPMYAGKPTVFDAFISHMDEITHLPPGAVLLASNAFTHVQAVSVTHESGTFWGLQYHPEYDLHEMARITFCRIDMLTKLGFFATRQAALDYVDLLETLHSDPARHDVAWLLGIDADLTSTAVRIAEVRNWIDRLLLPSMARRG